MSACSASARQRQTFGFLLKLRTRELLTPREAAEALHLDPSTVRRLVALGELKGPRYKLGGAKERTPRIAVASLIAYLAKSFADFGADDYDELLVIFTEKLRTRAACDRVIELATRQRQRLTD